MGVNQSKTQEKRRRKKELEDEGREKLPAIFSGHKVKGESSVEGLPQQLKRGKRSLSFRKKLKKNWTNWAAQRGLINPCKGEHTCSSHSQAPTKPSSVVLARKEQKKVVEVLVEEEEEDRAEEEEENKEEEIKEEEIKVVEIKVVENKEEEDKEEKEEQKKEQSQGETKIVTSVVVEKVDENDETENVNKDADVDNSPQVRRNSEQSPLDLDTEKSDDSREKSNESAEESDESRVKSEAVAAETLVASESIEVTAIQFAESPDNKSFENKSEEEEATILKPGGDEDAKDSDVREDVNVQVLEDIGQSRQAQQSNGEKIEAGDRCQVEEVLEETEVVKKEDENSTEEEQSSLEGEEVVAEDEKSTLVTESDEGSGACSQEACLVHQPEIVTDAEKEEDEESQEEESEEQVPKEIVDELIEQAIESARPTILAEPEPSKSADAFPLEGGWDEEDTWEDYDSEFDLEDCRQSRIPAYVEFEIGVWSSALWTSDMKWEKPVVAESEEVVGWGVPFDHLTNTSSNGTWSSSSSSGDEGARKDTFDESDFCDSPVNGGDDSVSTDEGIVASDDEVSEKAVSKKITKVIVDEPSPAVVNTV